MSEQGGMNQNDEQELFARLDGILEDPEFATYRKRIRKAENRLLAELEEDEDAYYEPTMDKLNNKWRDSELFQATVHISGRIRPFREQADLYGYDGVVEGCDEEGDYFQVVNMPFMCCAFGLNLEIEERDDEEDDEDSELGSKNKPKIGLTIIPETGVDEDVILEYGDFIIYLDDIWDMQFQSPSRKGIEAQLRYFIPGVENELSRQLSDPSLSTMGKIASLKNFYLPASDDENYEHMYQIVNSVGEYIFYKMRLDTAHYDIEVKGKIYSYSKGRFLTEDIPDSSRIRGNICAASMELSEDGSQYLPHFIVAEYAPETKDGFVGYLVSFESIETCESTRPKMSRFGKHALTVFNSPEKVRDYFTSLNWTTGYDSDEDSFSKVDNEDAESKRLLNFSEYKHIEGYDNKNDTFFISVNEDIQALITDYQRFCQPSDEPLLHHEQAAISKLLERTFESLPSLRIGDVIESRGKTYIVDKSNADMILVTERAEAVRGTVAGFTVQNLPHEPIGFKQAIITIEQSSRLRYLVKVITARDKE